MASKTFFQDHFNDYSDKLQYVKDLKKEVLEKRPLVDADGRIDQFLDRLEADAQKNRVDPRLQHDADIMGMLEEISEHYEDETLGRRADALIHALFYIDIVKAPKWHGTWGEGKTMEHMSFHQTEKGNWSARIDPSYRIGEKYQQITKIGARTHGHNDNHPGVVFVDRLDMMVQGMHSHSQEGVVFDNRPKDQQTVVAVILSSDKPWKDLNEDGLNNDGGNTLFYAAPESAVICGLVPAYKKNEVKGKTANVDDNGVAIPTKAYHALKRSINGDAVRIIRKAGCSDVFPKQNSTYSGYRYDGLYRVIDEKSRQSQNDPSKSYPVFEMRRLPDYLNEGTALDVCMQRPDEDDLQNYEDAMRPITNARQAKESGKIFEEVAKPKK